MREGVASRTAIRLAGAGLLALCAATALLVLPGVGAAGAEMADLGHLDATRSRPLFSPTRRAPPVAVAPAAPAITLVPVAPPPPPPAFQLSGVVIGADKTVAIVTRLADARVVSLEVGQTADGWTVTAIRPREIEVRQGSRLLTIRLSER